MQRTDPLVLGRIAAVCAAYAALSFVVQNTYYQHVLTIVAIFAVLGLSWNVLGGYAGVVSFGHAAFFGIGAFAVTLLLSVWNVTPWLGIPVGMAVAALAAVLIGLPTLRLRGIHFALAMLAYPIVLRYVLDWLRYQEVMLPRKAKDTAWFMQFDDVHVYALLAIAMLFVAMCVCHVIERSRFGLALRAIKQNEQAAAAAGIDIWRRKMVATAISGAMAGAAGGLYVVVIRVAVPADVFGLHVSAQAMVVTLFGGIGTLWGPLIGAAFLIPLGEGLHAVLGHTIPGVQSMVYGVALILAIMVAPEGLFWYAHDRWTAWRGSRGSTAAAAQDAGRPQPAPGTGEAPAAHSGSGARQGAGTLLQVRNLSKSFRGVKAVDDVGFDVPEGVVFGLIGQNGAGKTSTFNLLNGFIRADAGSALFAGRDLVGLSPTQVSRLGVGRTFQVPRPFPRLSVMDNVLAGAISTEPDDAAAVARSRQALATLGLAARAEALAAELNAVELRLLELGRALAGSPRLLLLDEIFAGLAHEEIEQLLLVIRRLPREGVTVMIIEHTMHAMLKICDHLVVLDHGVVIASGAPMSVINDPTVVEAYLGRKWMAEHAAA
ncbi:ABC transporter permease subunit [Ramlibacter sp.]|uniref:branched-chain amino acid ABC transporter ATP-binding protein/permease n=1 Tax=Ramlibacter sp. TaxID=1917967 RepID=UPI003D0A709D